MISWFQTASGSWHWASILLAGAWLASGLFLFATLSVNHSERVQASEKVRNAVASAERLQNQVSAASKEVADAKALTEKAKTGREQNTSDTTLPDGRVKVGDTVSGKPTVLQRRADEMRGLYSAERYDDAYRLAAECVKNLEDSLTIEKTARVIAGGLEPAGVVQLYTMASELAQRTGQHANALAWARIAVEKEPNAHRKALLVVCLLNADLAAEAQVIVNETLSKNDSESVEFREKLIASDVIKKQ